MKGLLVVGVLASLGQMPAVARTDGASMSWIDYDKLFKDHASEIVVRHDQDGDHATIIFPDGGVAYRSGPSDKPHYSGSSSNRYASCVAPLILADLTYLYACPQSYPQVNPDEPNKQVDQILTYVGLTSYPPRNLTEMREMIKGWSAAFHLECPPKVAERLPKGAPSLMSDQEMKDFDVATIKPGQLTFGEACH